ncbi:MAG: ABC transporter permease [Candidatus Cloacimonetes bacterium]|nr:ABC transporter permease [Candidatus Cloacimonadota bacterium]
MLFNYLKTAFRNITRQKFYSLLNIVGLAISITCCIMISLYIKEELSYDKFHKDGDQIYRLCNRNNIGGKIDKYCNAPRPISPKMREIYPEIEATTRACGINGLYTHSANLSYEENVFNSDKFYAVDSTFFDVFDVEFIAGTPEEALTGEVGITIAESLAKKLFGDMEALGNSLLIDDRFPVIVKGIFRDLPGRSHFEYDALLPWAAAYRFGEENAWYGWQVYHYLKLVKGTDVDALEAKFPQFFNDFMKERYDELDGVAELSLQPIKDIHLKSDLVWEMAPNGNINNVYILLLVGIFLLAIACINYVNLATARSLRRAKEVGLRKVFGSPQSSIVWQFILESVIIATLASFLALVLAELLMPVFNNITSRNVNLNFTSNLDIFIGTIFIGIIVGFLSGMYPAFIMSHFDPIKAMKSKVNGMGGMLVRKILIVLQFSISITLIIVTMIVIQQMKFARNIDLGFNKDNVLAMTIRDTLIERNLVQIKQEFNEHPDIVSSAYSYNMPGSTFNRFPATVENNEGTFDRISCQFMQIDYDFIDMMDMTITEGRNFDRELDENWLDVVLVNEAAVARFGWDEPIGKRVFSYTDTTGVDHYIDVAGVVKDFHPNSVRQEISPIIIYLINDEMESRYRENLRLYVHFSGNDVMETVNTVRNIIREFSSDDAFQYVFLDEHLSLMYESEEKLIQLFSYFTGMIIFIACLGLFGLASYSAEKRKKEIGIRKVLGATINQIVVLLSKEFSRWVLLANVIAWPAAWYFTNKWLQNFAYKVEINILIFVLAGVMALLIALITVGLQALRAGVRNPVTSIRYE